MFGRLIFLAGALAMLATASRAQDKPEGGWWNTPEVMRCCSEADAVYADDWRINSDGSVTATVTGGGPRNHAWAPIGQEYVIPAEKVISIPGNPTGRPIMFLRPWSLTLLCFAKGPMI